MAQTRRWTSADLDQLPNDGKRYEIIEGDLYVSKQPQAGHQAACAEITGALTAWNSVAQSGVVLIAPGLIFAEDDDVAPDVVWISRPRLAQALDQDGHLRAAPELVVEVLSPGSTNEHRDRAAKLGLYARRGVLEYWIADWRRRSIDVFRRQDAALPLVATLGEEDSLESPHLPGFRCAVGRLFFAIASE